MEEQKMGLPANEQTQKNNKTVRIIAIVAGAIVLIGGITAGGIYLATRQTQTTVIESGGSESIALKNGENKIKAGGTYTFTGSTSNGKIEIDNNLRSFIGGNQVIDFGIG